MAHRILMSDEEADAMLETHPKNGYLSFGIRRREVLRDIIKLIDAGFTASQIEVRLVKKYGELKKATHSIHTLMQRYSFQIQQRQQKRENLIHYQGYQNRILRAARLMKLVEAIEMELYDDEGYLKKNLHTGQHSSLITQYRLLIQQIEDQLAPLELAVEKEMKVQLPDDQEGLRVRFQLLLKEYPDLRQMALEVQNDTPITQVISRETRQGSFSENTAVEAPARNGEGD